MKKYDYIETLTDEMVKTRAEARKLTKEYFFLDHNDHEKKYEILKKLFGSVGKNVAIDTKIHCNFGKNTFIGDDIVMGGELHTHRQRKNHDKKQSANRPELANIHGCSPYFTRRKHVGIKYERRQNIFQHLRGTRNH